ncbi:MAG TPA: OmpA family protein [Vicinamibacteria bacterium]|nr:OmpA family protein [Vicinamibacteria bacterium]
MRTQVMRTLAVGAVVALGASGCATKKYVQREVGDVNQKADNLSSEMEKTQQRVNQNETRIAEVDREAQAGKQSAQEALNRAADAEKAAKGKLIYQVTLTDDQVKFPFGKAMLKDEAKANIEQAISALKTENKGVFMEVEGHTDSVGSAAYNKELGEKRAMAVRDYLHDDLGIALNRIEVISYGESQPVTDNKTRTSRAENRRVVIKVLE